MALKFYWANDLTGGGVGALDKIPTANWLDKYGAIVVKSGYLYAYECDDDLTGSEDSPWLIIPDDESGDLRLNLLGAVFADVKTKLAKLYDTDFSNTLSLKWNEASAADYVLNLAVGGASRTLTLNENLTIGDGTNITITGVTAARTITLNENFTVGNGTDITITGVTAARTLTLNENFTIGNGYDGTLTFSAASKVLTVDESETTSNYHTDARGDARYYTETELSNQTAGSEGSKLVGFHSHTLHDHLLHLTNKGVMEGCVVSDAGTLDITWTSGMIWDSANEVTMTIASGSGTCSNNLVNYLYSDYSTSTTVLQLSTTFPTETDMVLVAIIWCQDGDIWQLEHSDWMNLQLADLHSASLGLFPSWVVSGMTVSEDENVDNALDVTMAAGVLYHGNHHRETIAQVDTRTTLMVRHFHTATAWDSDTNAEIDTANYDNGTQKTDADPANWFKAVFLYTEGKLHWVYPRVIYATRAQALGAPIPAIPPGLARAAYLTAIVYNADDATFATTDWIDIRVGLAEAIATAPVTNHDYLAGVSADDHHAESHSIVSHSDIVDATGANIEELTGSGETSLHTHAGGDLTFTNVNAVLATANAAIDINSQNLTSVGTIGCGPVSVTSSGIRHLELSGSNSVDVGASAYVFCIDAQPIYSDGLSGSEAVTFYGMYFAPVSSGTHNTSSTLYMRGLVGIPALTGTITAVQGASSLYGMQVRPNMGAAGTFPTVIGAHVSYRASGASAIITSGYSLYVPNPGAISGGTITTNYGIYLENQTAGGTNYSVYSAGGANYFAGKTSIGGTVAPVAQLHVDQSVSDAAIPVLALDQADVDDAFINFIGNDGADIVSISSTEQNTFFRMIRIEINGTGYWLKSYSTAG